jgi:hypothetical protein
MASSTVFVSATRVTRLWIVDKFPTLSLGKLGCSSLNHECYTFSIAVRGLGKLLLRDYSTSWEVPSFTPKSFNCHLITINLDVVF